jgi:Zn-dependent protease
VFRLFGFPVHIRWWFFLISLLLMGQRDVPTAALGALSVGLAILIHELGHAFVARATGAQPSIELHGFGGLTRWQPVRPVGWILRVAVSLAGPLAGFLGAGLVLAFVVGWSAAQGAAPEPGQDQGMLPPLVVFAFDQFLWATLVWGAINLLPIWPLDGAQALGAVLDRFVPSRATTLSQGLSLVTGVLTVIAFVLWRQYIAAVIFAAFAFQSYLRLRPPPPPPVPPRTPFD